MRNGLIGGIGAAWAAFPVCAAPSDRSEPSLVAWMGGVFDGEGCISVGEVKRPPRTYYRVMLLVVNTKRELLIPFSTYFGGWMGRRAGAQDHHLPIFTWNTTGTRHTESVLRALSPWLIAKADQAGLALEACGLIGGTGQRKTTADNERLAEIKEAMHAAKGPASHRYIKGKEKARQGVGA